jgi:biopolymer transport protein ExbD
MNVGSSQGGRRYHLQAEINMIPLIDVALVLLIIFMVISPILVESQMRVNLPKVTAATNAEESAIKIQIAADGKMVFQGKDTSRAGLRLLMQNALPPGHKAALLIQADKDVAFNDVVFVMDLAKQLKVEKLGISVVPETTLQ